jgi:hypothetical protein
VQDALPIVIVAVVVVAGLVGVATLLSSRSAYDHIGRSGMVLDHEAGAIDGMSAGDPLRDEEIRQMLEAANARRAAQGKPLLALEDLAGPPAVAKRPPDRPSSRDAVVADEGLRAEVRAFVIARNERLIARGKPPLDVEAEVDRRLSGQER